MIKKKNNHWIVDLRPDGAKGKRIIRQFATKAEALRFESYIRNQATQAKPWEPQKKEKTRIRELYDKWYEAKGKYLNKDCSVALIEFIEFANNSIFSAIQQSDWIDYQAHCQSKGNSLKTIKNKLGYINAFFNWAKKNKLTSVSNPFAEIELPKMQERELHYLTLKEIQALLEALEGPDREMYLIAKVCLSTGARLGEAQSLRRRQIQGNKLLFTQTKSKKNRAVGISEELKKELLNFTPDDQLFSQKKMHFDRVLKRLDLHKAKGQASHIFRHSFASHFILNGGNILSLQKILGHSSIAMTMRYAHLAKDYANDAIQFKPKF